MENKKYEYNIDLVGTRKELHSHDEHWYMQQLMTGAEAKQVCHIILRRWYNETKNEEILWRAGALISDYSLYYEWAMAIEEMLDEKAGGHYLPGTPPWVENTRFEPCKCCDKCKYSSSAQESTADTKEK
jgi:hypothetical protein